MTKNNDCGCTDSSKSMSRGEFIGKGAAVAAAASLGSTEVLNAQPRRSESGLACGVTCPPTDFLWGIPAGELNVIWSEVYPRLVAKEWETAGSTNLLDPSFNGAALRADTLALAATAPDPEFAARATAAANVLGNAGSIPVSMRGRGGYDFLLTDRGLELVMPDVPGTKAEMLRYYTFRRTGRPAIGLPGYLTAAVSAVATDSPTGPSQIAINQAAVLALLDEFPNCDEATCIRQGLVFIGPREGLPIEEYVCLVKKFRCWYLFGSAYRGIMTEIPRIVANIWLEEELGTDALPGAYTPRFTDPGDNGLRSIFEERLETEIHEERRMHFEVHPLSAPLNVPWNANDVMVTNKGLYFPEPAAGGPSLDQMLVAMVAGRAGNPVFTDSKRTD